MAINDILVRDLSLPSKTSDFRVTAANPLLNQTGILTARNIMNQPGVTNIEGSLIPGDRPIPSYENYEDLIMNPDFMPNRLQNLERFADNRFEDLDFQPGFNFKDAPNKTSNLIESYQNRSYLNNPNRGIIDNLILSRGNPDASLVNKTKDIGKKGFNMGKQALLSAIGFATGIPLGIVGMLPEMDPRQKALREVYGYDNIGRVPQGQLMAGYNPVSGGLLNMLTGGKMGEETTYGLGRAIDKRMARIQKTLDKQRKDKRRKESEVLQQRLKDLQALKDREAAALKNAQKSAVYASAKEQGFTNDRGGFDTSAADRAGTSEGSGQFSPSTSRGRSGY